MSARWDDLAGWPGHGAPDAAMDPPGGRGVSADDLGARLAAAPPHLVAGLLLQGWRRAAGLTQDQLGTRLGVGKAAVSRWESGAVRPDVARLWPLVSALAPTPAERGRMLERLARAFALAGEGA